MSIKKVLCAWVLLGIVSAFALGMDTEENSQQQSTETTQTSAVENTENTQDSESISDEEKDERDCDEDGCYDENGYNDFGNKKIIKPKQDEAYFTYRKEIPLLYEKCKNGDKQSCLKYADYYANGKGVVQNFSIAQEQFASLCRSGNAKACAGLEDSYAKQLNIGHIYKKGLAALQAECNKNNGKACALAGIMLESNMAKNKNNVFATYKKGCANNNALSCYNIGLMNKNGKGVVKSELVAVEFLFKACKLDKYYCDGLNDMGDEILWLQENGKITEEELDQVGYSIARDAYEQSCRANNSRSCVKTENDCLMQERACRLDDPFGCAWLAGMVEDGLCSELYHDDYMKKARELGKRDTTYGW